MKLLPETRRQERNRGAQRTAAMFSAQAEVTFSPWLTGHTQKNKNKNRKDAIWWSCRQFKGQVSVFFERTIDSTKPTFHKWTFTETFSFWKRTRGDDQKMGSSTFLHETASGKKSIPLRLCVYACARTCVLVYIMLKCMCKLLCVSLPVALARLLPPPRLYCPQTDCSPTAAPAHCFNMFWQRRLFYRGSRRPSAVRSVKLRCAKWLGSLRGETWLFFFCFFC